MTDEDIVRKFKSLYCGVCYFQVCSECHYKSPFMKGYRCAEKDLLPVWHDLRKNPEDLPSRSDENEDKSNRVITDKGIGFYHYRKGKWYTSENEEAYLFARNVIAWCEIPKFEE